MIIRFVHNVQMLAAIVGAAGYSGQETLDRLLAHPTLEIAALGSDSLAGEPASALDIRLDGTLPRFVSNVEALASGADVLFWCLGHEEAAALEPPPDTVVIDLSGAHRLRDGELYPAWYGFEHPQPETPDFASMTTLSGATASLRGASASRAAVA